MSNSVSYKSLSGALILDASKTAFLPKSQTLLVADLHFEKGSYLNMQGNAVLPAYDTADTLSRLKKTISDYVPQHVVALGDSFHDTRAGERLSPENANSLNELIADLPQFTWILGNHDPDVPSVLSGEREDRLEIDGFLLTHLPTESNDGQTNICGHLHPKARLTVRRRRMSHPCFACSDSRIILPSFGAYTGGLWTNHPAIDLVMGENRLLALTTADGIFPIKN